MTVAILNALVAVLPVVLGLVAGWLQRRWQRHDDPLEQHRRRGATAEADVAGGDPRAASRHGLDDLAELERLQKRPRHPKR